MALHLRRSALVLKDWSHRYHKIVRKNLPGLLLFVISFLWFSFPAEYVLIANRDLSLFICRPDYLASFLDRPGGLLEYSGAFLTQFYRFRFAGALVLSAVITGAYFVCWSLLARISGSKDHFAIAILPAILLLGMHNYYPHQIGHTLGFLLSVCLISQLPSTGKNRTLYLVLTVPLFYFLAGGFLWFYCGLVLVKHLALERKVDIPSVLIVTLYPLAIIVLGSRLLFLDPLRELAINPLPVGEEYGRSIWPYLFMGWMIFTLLLATVLLRILQGPKILVSLGQIFLSVLLLVLVMHFSHNRRNREFFHIEKLALMQDWDQLLAYTADHPSRNLFGMYYTNLALVNQGKLCHALFQYPQSFGRRALCFNWEAKGEILRRGSDFFWTVRFVNEAHHWAFESMIIDGFTRRNLTMLIKTELVRGNYKLAEKYIDLLGKAMFQKKTARHYAGFLHQREAISGDPELGPRLRTRMDHDFFSEGVDLEINLRSLLANDPANLPAQDYLMALLLLEKEIDKIVAALPVYLEASRGILPPLLEECLLVYKITQGEEARAISEISPATLQRFDAYTRILRQYRDRNEAARMLYPDFGNSFWFYLNFVSLPNQ
jgi:hypothetical protein